MKLLLLLLYFAFQVCCPAQTDWNAYLRFHETIVSQELAFQDI